MIDYNLQKNLKKNMETFRNQLANIIYEGLISINNKSHNINVTKTNKKYLREQLTSQLVNKYIKLKNNSTGGDYDFYKMISNGGFGERIKIFIMDNLKPISLSSFLKRNNELLEDNYAENKLFYLYFNIVLVDNFSQDYKSKLKINHVKERLEQIIENNCRTQKNELQACLRNKKDKIEVIPMSNFSKNIDEHCKIEKTKFEQCILYPSHTILNKNSNNI